MAKKKPTLCIVAGPNGSGKTTTTIQLLQNEWTADSFYINPDNIAQESFGDWNSPEAVLKAAQEATKLRYDCLSKKKNFVFETVFSSDEKVDFVRKATRSPFQKFVLVTTSLASMQQRFYPSLTGPTFTTIPLRTKRPASFADW